MTDLTDPRRLPSSQEKLECLCKLLSTTGKRLELRAEINLETSKKQRRLIDKYFKEVKALSENTAKLSARTRFLLKVGHGLVYRSLGGAVRKAGVRRASDLTVGQA